MSREGMSEARIETLLERYSVGALPNCVKECLDEIVRLRQELAEVREREKSLRWLEQLKRLPP